MFSSSPPLTRTQENIRKLINAKYCDKFAHAQWTDGTVVHVHVTAEQQRVYEERMRLALDVIRRRCVREATAATSAIAAFTASAASAAALVAALVAAAVDTSDVF